MSWFTDIFSSSSSSDDERGAEKKYNIGGGAAGTGAGTAFEADEDTQRRVRAMNQKWRDDDAARAEHERTHPPIVELWDRLFGGDDKAAAPGPSPHAGMY